MITPEPSELQELVRALHQQATPWQPAGLGSRLSWGPPVADGSPTVSCSRLRGIVEHSPGDFTVTAQAGTPLVEVQAELAHHGQWLALDWPWGSGPAGEASGSLGGLVARGLAGGLRQRYLGVRDQLIGIELIRADGTRARAGGKVVKNVAGYDLMRLFTGSWGALGLITSVTLRTLPLPPERRGLWLSGPLEALGQLSGWLLSSSLSPERIDWWRADPAQGGDTGLLISLASINARTLEEQIACIAAKAPPLASPPCRWSQPTSMPAWPTAVAQGPRPVTGCCAWPCAPARRPPCWPSPPWPACRRASVPAAGSAPPGQRQTNCRPTGWRRCAAAAWAGAATSPC